MRNAEVGFRERIKQRMGEMETGSNVCVFVYTRFREHGRAA
jgi:hypothetical protein